MLVPLPNASLVAGNGTNLAQNAFGYVSEPSRTRRECTLIAPKEWIVKTQSCRCRARAKRTAEGIRERGRRSDAGRATATPAVSAGVRALLWLSACIAVSVSNADAALPIFENRTPAGFSPSDSTAKTNFVEGETVTVRTDLNQAATPTHPVYGHFHNLEVAQQLDADDVDGLQADVAVSDDGTIHMAWISSEVVAPVATPVYYVRYSRTNGGGTPSVSGSLRFDVLTINGAGTSFSTVDLEVDSRGNPRVAYAFNEGADGNTVRSATEPDNVYFNYSNDGGITWFPQNGAVVVNDTATVGEPRTAAFPRLAIDQRDNIFLTYVRGSSSGGAGATDDVMVAKVNRQTSPFTMEKIGPTGNASSAGGVRIVPDGERQTGPDIAIGTGDVLHVVFFHEDGVTPANSDIEHKSLLADMWDQADASGWNQSGDGADVDDFDPSTAGNPALDANVAFYFPTVVVDQQSSPDRIYALYKFGDATFETVFFNNYTYDNAIAGNAGWSTATASAVWSTANSGIFQTGEPFWNIELDWTVTERVSAVVDDRLSDHGELHIAFSAGFSNTATARGVHDIYYGFYNGSSWTLPETVADADDGVSNGILAADVFLSSPALAKRTDDSNLALIFAGGLAEGLGIDEVTDVNQHPYLKILGRDVTFEDESIPVGGFQYDMEYTPSFPHAVTGSVADSNHAVYVHVADNSTGQGLGASGNDLDGFLAGNWETVAATLADDNKVFEGKINEDATTTREWGDDDDKIGLLVKLNVLASNSTTNVQQVTNSTASAAGTGFGTRTIRVGANPSTFVLAGDFFMLGADIDIIDSNTAPVVAISEPNGVGDVGNTSFLIKYTLNDPDDDFASGGLLADLYFSEHSDLASVQDIRIFGTLIVDENDNSSVFASGTNDFKEGTNQTYTWDDPPAALDAVLFASIEKVPSGTYFIYLVADDQKNLPVFVRSPGSLTILHKPIVAYVDPPAGADTVDTGVRSGELANPYDLDFLVRDFDRQGETEVQLFYSSSSGLSSVQIIGTYPNQSFKLTDGGASRAFAIDKTDTLTSADTEFSWDLLDPVFTDGVSSNVAEGAYFIYVVASDSANISVGQSAGTLIVKHSPSFVFYDPPRDTHREIDTGSQPVFTIQWQKGRGDGDFDDDATIDLYFTTDNSASINYEEFPDSLLNDADTRIVVKGLSEDADGAADMYEWDLREPPNDVPVNARKVWLYALISDGSGNTSVALGGALTMTHRAYINILSADLSDLGNFNKNDVLRLTWDDYLVDDGSGTDDAYIRLYAEPNPSNLTTLADLESMADFFVNSTDGTSSTIQTIREDSVNFFDWNTKLFGVASTNYDIYAAINPDATFSSASSHNQISKSLTPLLMMAAGSTPNVSVSPTDLTIAAGDTAVFDVMIQHNKPINLAHIILKVNATDFLVVDQDATETGNQPFIDLDNIFSGTTPIENTFDSSLLELRFAKSSFGGELVGSPTQPVALARFEVVGRAGIGPSPSLVFATGSTGTVLGVIGESDPFHTGTGMTAPVPDLSRALRGTITAVVELEGRTIPPALGDHTTLLDIHLRKPGSTVDIDDQFFIDDNDEDLSTADSIEVSTDASGNLTLDSVPAGRWVLTVKDTSHISGRTDTITIRNGQMLDLDGSGLAFFGSDLRGDPTLLLGPAGRELVAGDVSEDNEINEDDVNLVISAWGTDDTVPFFEQADINNDDEVGAADLTVTTSNFGNSVGFGAPPVFKPIAGGKTLRKPTPRGDNSEAILDLKPLFDQDWRPRPGSEMGFEVVVKNLEDLAGYEFEVGFNNHVLELLPERTEAGNVFEPNPLGAVFETRSEDGTLKIISSRVGKLWTAAGEASLARVWFRVSDEQVHESVDLGEGILLNPVYEPAAVNWARSFTDLVLPTDPGLDQNYPNPFNPSTAIPFVLPREQEVRIEVYNVLGQRIRTLMSGPMAPGFHTLLWNGRDDAGRAAAAGLYLTLLETGDFRQARKMMLVK